MSRGRTWIFLPSPNGGGAERAVLRYLACMNEMGVEGGLILRSRRGVLWDEFQDAGVPIIGSENRTRTGGSLGLYKALVQARRAGELDPEHDTVVVFLSGALTVAVFRAVGCRNVHLSLQNPVRGPLRTRISMHIVSRGRMAKSYVAITPGIRDELVSYGVPRDSVTLVPNPVSVEDDETTRRRSSDSGFRVLVVGRLAPQKRIDVALRAFAVARQPGWHLDIYGVGDLEPELRGLTTELGLDDAVTYRGFTVDLDDAYRSADVLLLTSDFEGFGNVIIEALARGTRVVSTDAPYGPRFIMEGIRGCELVPLGDVDAIAAALRRVASVEVDDETAARLRDRAADFDSARMTEQFLAAVGRAPQVAEDRAVIAS